MDRTTKILLAAFALGLPATAALCADWTPVQRPNLTGVQYVHDDGGALIIVCDSRGKLIRIMHVEPRASWTEGDTVNETTMDDDGISTTSKYGKAISPNAMIVENESTFDLFRMGQASASSLSPSVTTRASIRPRTSSERASRCCVRAGTVGSSASRGALRSPRARRCRSCLLPRCLASAPTRSALSDG
jgi:hypothetical protein